MKKYRLLFSNCEVEELEVVKETPKRVTYKSRYGSDLTYTDNKTSQSYAWFDTYAQANAKRIEILRKQIARAEVELDRLNDKLENALNEAG